MSDSTQVFTATSADCAALKAIRLQLGAFARRIDPIGSLADDAETIAAEILDNIREHSPGDSLVTVRARHATSVLELEFRDQGIAFDPLKADSPDLDVAIAERDIGGLGIHIVRSLANELYYHRSPEGENVLTVRLCFGEGADRRPRR